MLKMAVQQARSERRSEANALGYYAIGDVEELNEERTTLVDFFSILPVSFPGSADHDRRVPFQRTHRGATSWDLPTNLNWKPGGVAIAVSPVWMKPDGALWQALSSQRRLSCPLGAAWSVSMIQKKSLSLSARVSTR